MLIINKNKTKNVINFFYFVYVLIGFKIETLINIYNEYNVSSKHIINAGYYTINCFKKDK